MVSAIIPARNEELSIARAVESVAAQLEVGEVIVVNDQSTDRTAEILAELALRITKLKVLSTDQLPSGWTGKNNAVSIGAAAAQGEWLLFTDADTFHLPGSTRHALGDAEDHNAVLVSYSPEQEMETFWERALIPFVYWRLESKFSFARVNDPRCPDAAANGQFLLVQQEQYRAVGGHEAVAREIVEDVALARLMKASGCGIYFTAPVGVVRTRMYRTWGAMWQGWTKNLYPLMGGTSRSALIELAEVFPFFEILAVILMGVWMFVHRAESAALALLIVCAAFAGIHFRYALVLYRNQFPVSAIRYYVFGVCLYIAALVASWWKSTRGNVVWKGRAYPAKTS